MLNVLVLLACLGAGFAAPVAADPPVEKKKVFEWEKHDGLNCWWGGHGADELAGNAPGAPLKNSTDKTEIHTLGQCQAECVQRVDGKTKEKTECHAVLFQVATGMCYGKKNVDVSKCAKDETVALYMRPKATEWLGVDPALLPATTTPKPTTTTTTTTPAAPLGNVVKVEAIDMNNARVDGYACPGGGGQSLIIVTGDPVTTKRGNAPWGPYGRAAYLHYEKDKDTCATEVAEDPDFEPIRTVKNFEVAVLGIDAVPVGRSTVLGVVKDGSTEDYLLTVKREGANCVLYYNKKNDDYEPVQGITKNWRLVTSTTDISDEIKCNPSA